VLPARDWVERIVEAFRTRDVTFVFGKVLPRWGRLPPPELLTPDAREIVGPLAIVDYGDTPGEYRAWNPDQDGPIGANLSFSRSAVLAAGGWRTDRSYGTVAAASEDHEMLMRLHRCHLYAGFYDPHLTVRHFVPADKLTRQYFRRWFFHRGRTQARILDELDSAGGVTSTARIVGALCFACGQGLEQCGRWLRSLVTGDALSILIQELWLFQCAGFVVGCWRRRYHRLPDRSVNAALDMSATNRSAGAH
jgi:hypothetical protein